MGPEDIPRVVWDKTLEVLEGKFEQFFTGHGPVSEFQVGEVELTHGPLKPVPYV